MHTDEHQPAEINLRTDVECAQSQVRNNGMDEEGGNMSETSRIWGDLPPRATPNGILTHFTETGDRLRQQIERA